jgi:hypothetical protein
MEHLERLGHGAPWLLANPVFLLGLALQLPFALAAWWIARTVLRLEVRARRRPARRPRLALGLVQAFVSPIPAPTQARPRPRGPPALL